MKMIKNQNFKQYPLSNEEKGRLANFISLLFKIDKRINGNRKKSKKRSNKKSRNGIDTFCFL